MLRALFISGVIHLVLLSILHEQLVLGEPEEKKAASVAVLLVSTSRHQPIFEKQDEEMSNEVAHPAADHKNKFRQSVESQNALFAANDGGQNEHEIHPVSKNVSASASEGNPAQNMSASPDALRQYGIVVAREARKYKKFPAMARQRGWEGEVNVVIGSAIGALSPQVTLSKGSGFEALDQAALEMVRNAVKDAVMPDELRSKSFALSLPIRFSLED